MYLVTALGNPGEKYAKSRHNVAWILMDEIFGSDDWETSSQGQALYRSEGDFEVIKPTTFMNRSGESVRFFVKKYSLESRQVVVIHDDIDLPVGTFKIAVNRGDGGHNGVKSIIEHLKTKDFIRIRVGVSRKRLFSNKLAKLNVLGNFSSSHLQKIADLAPTIKNALETIVKEGAHDAMNTFN